MVALLTLVASLYAADFGDDAVLERLGTARDRALTAFPGCYRMQGKYESDYSLGLLGGQKESALVKGVLRDGIWEGREIATAAAPELWFPARHLAMSAFGIEPTATQGSGWGPILLKVLPGTVSAEYAERRGGQWALLSTLDGGPRSSNTMVTLFDEDPLRVRTVQARVTSPIRGIVDGGHKIRIIRLTMDLVVGPDGAPQSESLDMRFGQGVVTGDTRLRVVWQSSPCGA